MNSHNNCYAFIVIFLKGCVKMKIDYNNVTINELFERQVNETPENTAIVFNNLKINYADLDKKANQLANLLIANNITEEDIVAIVMERSIDFIISILGVLKSGAAYIPIDPAFPPKRIEYMLNEANVKVLITEKNVKVVNSLKCDKKFLQETETYSEKRCSIRNTANSLMYVLYTSGSTGDPKGVMVEHRNVASYVHAFKKEFNISEKDIMLQQSVCTFDIFVEEVFPIILTGGTLVIAENNIVKDELKLMDLLEKEGITITSSFPYLLNKLNKIEFTASKLRLAISGGDVLRPEFITNIKDKVEIYNTYGPSETTVCASYFKYDGNNTASNRIPIGSPIENYQIYIMDEEGNELPPGEIGEICISGNGVSRGYLNKPELTAKLFIFNNKINKRIYKTGDLGVFTSSGNIEFIKRKDEQVMIEGRRVESGEVENCLYKLNEISNAFVLPLTDSDGYSYLCAYITLTTDIKISKIKNHLEKYLPNFMVPEFFIKLKTIPLTLNGKVDKKSFCIPMK